MSALSVDSWEAIRKAALLIANGDAKRIDGEGWSVYFVPSGDSGTIRIDVRFGAT